MANGLWLWVTRVTGTVHSIAGARGMACLARVVVPGLPCHVTQRGNGGQKVFFSDVDHAAYRELLAAAVRDAGVAIWAWRLMPNHV